LTGTIGRTATTSQSSDPERSAMTTASIQATIPVTNAVAPTAAASTPTVPVPLESDAGISWYATADARKSPENSSVLCRVTKGFEAA
jgi:hypothetical protein